MRFLRIATALAVATWCAFPSPLRAAEPGLDRLREHNGQTLRDLCAGLEMARQSVSKHLAILEAANLVAVLWRGREKLHFLNPVPLQEIYDRWIRKFERSRLRALRDLKKRLEGRDVA